MSSSARPTTSNSDLAFTKQVDATREALSNFNAISQLNAPGPVKLAMDELLNTTVSSSFKFLSPLFLT